MLHLRNIQPKSIYNTFTRTRKISTKSQVTFSQNQNMVHNEKICHDTGGRRLHYLNQIKCILNKIDTQACPTVESKDPNLRPLSEYEVYRAKEGNKKEPFVPLITNVQIKEVRRTSHLADHEHENCRNLEYVPVDFLENQHAPIDQRSRLKSFELKGGYLIPGCICSKRDGLQDKCELQGCQQKDLCLADPRPLCAPANVTFGGDLPEEVKRHIPEPPPKKCCCDKPWTKQQLPENFECYPCYDGRGPGH